MKNYLEIFESVASGLNLRIVSFNQVGHDLLEVIIAYADSSDHVDLETSSKAAQAFAEAIDYDIALDVSSEGAEKEIDLNLIENMLGEYIFIKFKNPKAGFDQVEGELVEVSDDALNIKYRFKHTYKMLSVERNNIDLVRLAVKI